MNPHDVWAMASKGEAYFFMKQYNDALVAYNQAVEELEFIEGHEWILRDRAMLLHKLERYEESITDLDRVIESNPQFAFNWLSRGKAYLILRSYESALTNFDHAANLMSQKDWCFYNRALTHLALNQPDTAKSDLDYAIRLAQQKYEDNPDNHRNTFNLAIYHVVANNIEQSKQFYGEVLRRGAYQSQIQEAIQDLEDLLKVFPNYRAAQQIREALLKRIGDSQ